MQAGVVGAALEHGVRRVDLGVGGGDRLDQPRDVALDELVLERQGRGRDHHPLVVEQGRDEVGQRLAGAGAGLDDEVPMARQRLGDRLGHRDLSGALLTAESLTAVPNTSVTGRRTSGTGAPYPRRGTTVSGWKPALGEGPSDGGGRDETREGARVP